jgi:coenzyme F420 hydrogenase subunit delta
MTPDPTPIYVNARCLVLGCGNILYGDDGFGPCVAARLEAQGLPPGVVVIDAGTGVRKVLFNLLLSYRLPLLILVIDSVDQHRNAGEVFWLDLSEMPMEKTDDFSMHQAPTSNLLAELRDHRSVTVEVLACQPASIPTEVTAGLSPEVDAAVGRACALVYERCIGFLAGTHGEAANFVESYGFDS